MADENCRFSTVEERAGQEIIKLIIDHKYLPGEKLQEVDLAKELSMSRTPVRNALRKLAAEGFLDMQANRGCTVPFLALEDMRALFCFRAELEGIAASQAAGVIDKGTIEELQTLLDNEKNVYRQSDALNYNNINERIHKSVVEASGNNYLIRSFRPVFLRAQLYIYYYDRYCREKKPKAEYVELPETHRSIVEHSKLLWALAEGEPEMAGIVAKRHVLSTMEQLMNAFFISGAKIFDF